jgi:hypothetical protein
MNSYFVPNFPTSKIKIIGEDNWVHIENHPKKIYGWLDAILELIDNTGKIDPIQISVWDEKNVIAGPCGSNRLYALVNIREIKFVPAIVYTNKIYEWFGDDYELITNEKDVLKYFRNEHRPDFFYYNHENKQLTWQTDNVYDPKKIVDNMMVSKETKNRLLKMIEEEKKLRMI